MRAMPTPSANDGPGFHSNMPVSELAERDTRAIMASVVSSAPPVTKTMDRVTYEIRPTPTEPNMPDCRDVPGQGRRRGVPLRLHARLRGAAVARDGKGERPAAIGRLLSS